MVEHAVHLLGRGQLVELLGLDFEHGAVIMGLFGQQLGVRAAHEGEDAVRGDVAHV